MRASDKGVGEFIPRVDVLLLSNAYGVQTEAPTFGVAIGRTLGRFAAVLPAPAWVACTHAGVAVPVLVAIGHATLQIIPRRRRSDGPE